MENQPEIRPDIYLIVLRSTIVLVLEHHSNLFDEDSLRQLSSILTLDNKSLTLLSRSLSRKYSWLRVDSVAAYLPSQSDLEEALNVLIDANALQLLQPDSKFPLDDLWPACSSLNVDELKVFSGFITNSLTKCNYGQEKIHLALIPDKTKDLFITRSLFNSKSLADRIPKILIDVLINTRRDKMLETVSSRIARGSGENMPLVANKMKSSASSKRSHHTEEKLQTDSLDVTSKNIFGGKRFEMDKLFLVRINPDLLKLMRRIQRFTQISSPLGSMLGGAGTVTAPINFNSPLMVAFNKVRYPQYRIFKSDSAPLFTARSFELWEVSCELRHSYDQAERLDHIAEKSRVMRSEGRNSADTDAHLASVYKSVLEAVVDASRRFHVRICCPTASGASSSFPPSSQLSILPVEICSDLLQSAYEGSMPFRLSLSLCCVVCLLSYTAEMEQTVRPFTCADKGAGSGYEDETDVYFRGVEEESRQCKAEEHHRTHVLDPANVLHSADLSSRDTHTVFPVRTFKPDFFVQLDSGSILSHLSNEGAALFEKLTPVGEYHAANEIYAMLLEGPFLPHRRGRWYERLRINFSHLKSTERSLSAVEKGLLDPYVTMGDRLNLERQGVTLRAKSRACAPLEPDPFSTSIEGLMALILQYSALLSSPPPLPAQSTCSVSSAPVVPGSDNVVPLKRSMDTVTRSNIVEEVKVVSLSPRESKMPTGGATGQQGGAVVDLTCSDDEEDFSQIFSGDNGGSKSHQGRRGGSSTGNKEVKVENCLVKGRGGSLTKKGSKSITKGSEILGEKTGSWTCSSCTFVNAAVVKFCDVCLLPFSKSIATITPATASDGLLDVKEDVEVEAKVKVITKIKMDVVGKVMSARTEEPSVPGEPKRKRVTAGGLTVTDMTHSMVVHSVDDEYQAPCGISMKRKAPAVTANQGDDEIEAAEIEYVMNDNLPEPLPICTSIITNSSDSADHPIDAHFPTDLSLSASASASAPGGVIERFRAFGYQYPLDSLEHTDLILLKLDGGQCEEGVNARDCGILCCSAVEDLREVTSVAPVPVAMKNNTSSSRRSSRISSSDSDRNNSSSYGSGNSNDNGSNVVHSQPQLHPQPLSQWQWVPPSCEVFGKRYGDPKRKGKSKFCDRNDEMISVESFIQQKCHIVDSDDSDSFRLAVDGGGWQGWHCEGSVLRSLFGLLLWDEIFSDRPDVFLTPYQDAPLDLCFPSFFRSRLESITGRLDWLDQATPEQLVCALGDSYRTHYKQKCRGVSWYHQLHSLQLIAVCLGGKGVSGVCRALAVNYKKFSSGAPDLLLIRVSRPRTRDSMSPPECLDLEHILGPSWSHLVDSEEGEPGDIAANTAKAKDTESVTKDENEPDDVIGSALTAPRNDEVKAVYKGKGRGYRWRKRKGADNDDLNSLQQSKEMVSENVVPGKNKRNLFVKQEKAKTEEQPSLEADSEEDTNEDELSFLEQEEAASPIINASSPPDSDLATAAMEVDGEGDETALPPLAKLSADEHYRFTSREPDLVLPVHPSHISSNAQCESDMLGYEGECSPTDTLLSRCHGGWLYECLMVEVKGPTDSLADHQLMWLRMLQRSGVTALVGHVKETEPIQ